MNITYDEKTKKIIITGIDRIGYDKNIKNDNKSNDTFKIR
jgi:hypothetical protein